MNRALLLLVLCGCGEAVIRTNTDAGGGDAGGGGGDAGAMGGGGGSSSFDAGGCEVAPAFTQGDLAGKAGFDVGGAMSPAFNFATMRRPNGARTDVMFNEFYAAAPVTNVSIPALNYELCQYCFFIQTNCDAAGANCTKGYLAQSGTLSVSAASKVVDAGSYAFQLSNVRYQAWDFVADAPLDGGCLAVGNFAFSGTWP